MSIEDIEKAVAGLPPDQYAEFRTWFEAFEADRFDRKIELDVQAGKLDRLADQAIDDLRKRVATIKRLRVFRSRAYRAKRRCWRRSEAFWRRR